MEFRRAYRLLHNNDEVEMNVSFGKQVRPIRLPGWVNSSVR